MDDLPDLPDYHPDDLQVRVAELLVATADDSDYALDGSIRDVLRLLRERMRMDVVFVSEFVDGQRVFKQVEQAQPVLREGDADPLEETWCQRVVDGRLPGFIPDAEPLQASGAAPKGPYPIGTFLSTPVTLPTGEVYGTMCCFSFAKQDHASQEDLKRLRFTADLAGRRIQEARKRDDFPPLDTVRPED